ncbi:hypothetical protein BV898_15440 [Hypsibius exemplaris]|uniref:Peptidase S1 domain-containing protein n=1 Tax=Hypsibius exemplaris TaxID=2072580 RepID=A0A9X6NCU6_HYPEX|nr:hypothetical protein BV898_15440 [Hypsibius exemplaris]
MPELAVSSAIIEMECPFPRHKYPFMVSLQFVDGTFISAEALSSHQFTRPDKEANHFRIGSGNAQSHKGNSDNHYFRVKADFRSTDSTRSVGWVLNDIALLTLDESVTRRRGLNAESSRYQPVQGMTPSWTTVRHRMGFDGNAVPGVHKDSPLLLQGALFRGDSGGPLFRQLPSRKYQLIGIASYVAGSCLQKGSANVFTRVSHHVDWIKAALRSSSSQCRRISERGLSCLICVRGSQHSKRCSRPSSPAITWHDNWAHGCDFPGNDISDHHIEPKLCGPKCQEVGECTHFGYNPTNGKCWLKRGPMTKGQAQQRSADWICGLRV